MALVHVANPSREQPRILQGGFRSAIGEAHASPDLGTATGGLRPGNKEDIANRHLLQYASPGLRIGCQQYTMDQQRRWWRRCGMAEHAHMAPDARCAKGARLDGARTGYEWQRQTRRLSGFRAEGADGAERGEPRDIVRAERPSRQDPRHKAKRRILRDRRGDRRHGLGYSAGVSWRHRPVESGTKSTRHGAGGIL